LNGLSDAGVFLETMLTGYHHQPYPPRNLSIQLQKGNLMLAGQVEGQRVVIVGAGSGIGRAIAIAAARAGAHLVLSGRNSSALEETAIALGNHDVEVIALDATEEAAVERYFPKIGAFDALVSTTTAGASGPLPSLDTDKIERALRAKLWSALFLAKYGARFAQPHGSMTFFSGLRGARPAAGTTITSLVNGGLEALVRALAVEFGPIRFNALSPGVIDSGPFWSGLAPARREAMFADYAQRTPLRRVGTPEEVAEAALFLMTHPFLTGTVLHLDGGAVLS
jgi:NAD(P)-dependent dehydrogenase (short-subunit alcohol dehydrogenase family)